MAASTEISSRHVFALALLFASWHSQAGRCDEAATGAPAAADAIVARVDGAPIWQRELDRELAPAAKLLEPQTEVPDPVKQRAIEQLIDRRLVLNYLIREQLAASDADVDLEVAGLKKRLEAQEQKLPEYLQNLRMTEAELRRDVRWRLSWQKYVAARLTDENLQKYFDKHRREFDGTELKVAHLLLKADPADSPSLEKVRQQAMAIRDDVESGKVTFADACRQHSQAPTAKVGGDIGFIRRREPMPEAFAAAAFSLDEKQVSQPVVTRFGIHLIQVLEVKPGQKSWQECRGELRGAVTQYLFRWLADRERQVAKVEVVGNKEP